MKAVNNPNEGKTKKEKREGLRVDSPARVAHGHKLLG